MATIEQRIEKKKSELEKITARIAADQAKAAKLTKEISELESFELVSLSKELNIPTAEIRSLLIEIKKKRQNEMADNQGVQGM